MICPNCEAIIDESSPCCENCGFEFNNIKTEPKKNKFSGIKSFKNIKTNKMIKLIGIGIIALLVVIIIILIFVAIFGNNGEKIASKLGEKCGKSISSAEKNADIKLLQQSAVEAINKQGDFDYIYESEKVIVVDGVHVPKWVIKIEMMDDNINTVSYFDYTQFKKYYKGEKLKKEIEIKEVIDAEDINKGLKFKNVKKIIDMEPYRIVYYDDQIRYFYSYYFINDDDDEQRVSFLIVCDDENIVESVS